MKDGGKRTGRVGEAIRDALAVEVRALRDPRALGVIVTRVEIDANLQRARVFVRHELGVTDSAARREMLRGLAAASGRLRREVAGRISLRTMPELVFQYDEAPDQQQRVEEILREIKDDEARRGPGGGGGGGEGGSVG